MDDNKIYKETEQIIKIQAENKATLNTNVIVYSYDKNTAKFLFQLTKNNQPISLGDSAVVTIALKFESLNGKAVLEGVIEDEIKGIVSIVIPEEYLGYQGSVTGGIYIDYSNGQSLDCGYFKFSMKRSMIDDELGSMPEYYVEGFENLRVEINDKSEEMKNKLADLDITFKELDVYNKSQIDDKVDGLKPAIDNVTAQLTQKAKQSDVDTLYTKKADIVYVNEKVQAANVAYKESYSTLIALKSAYPTGNAYNHSVLADGMIYTWVNNDWTNTQIQANGTGIPNESVSLQKLSSGLQDDVYFSITNLIKNGNFDATTNWVANGALFSVLNNTGIVKGNGSEATTRLFQPIGTVKVGDKIHLKLKVKVTNPNATLLLVTLTNVATNALLQNIITINTPVENQVYDIEKTLIPTATNDVRIQIYAIYADAATASGKTMEVQYVEAINLTADCGIGNEFNLAEVGSILSDYPNSWFDGSISVKSHKSLTLENAKLKESVNAIMNATPYGDELKGVLTYKAYINASNGVQTSNTSYNNIIYNCLPDSDYYITTSLRGNVVALAVFFDANGAYLSHTTTGTSTGIDLENIKITTPQNCYMIGVTSNVIGKYEQPIVKTKTTSKLINDVYNLMSNTAPLSNQTHLVIGDSISASYVYTTKHYHGFLSDELNTTVINKAASATGWLCNYNNGIAGVGDSLKGRIASGYFDNLTFDFCTIMMGTNDWGVPDSLGTSGSAPLGSINDTVNTMSIYGAVKYCLSNLIAKYPTKGFGVISPLPRSEGLGVVNGKGATLEQIITAIKECCSFYGIPFIDIIHATRLKPWNATNKAEYFVDGLHINNKGHEFIYKQLRNWVTTI